MISYAQNMVRLFQHSRQFYYITTDLQGNYTYVNHYFREKFSHLTPDFIGMSLFSTICSDDIERCQQAVNRCLAEPGRPISVELRKQATQDNYFRTKWEFSAFHGHEGVISGIQCIGVDITNKRARQESLEISERKYQYIFEEDPLPSWIYDVETLRFLEVNKAAIEQYGYSREEFLQMTILDIRPEDCRADVMEALEKPDDLHTLKNRHYRHLKKNGEVIQVDVHSFGFLFGGKKGRFVTSIDITEKLNQQQALEAVSARLKSTIEELNGILENVSEAIFKLDPDSNLVYMSTEFTRLTGYSSNDLAGKRWFDFIHPEDLDVCYDAFGRVFEKLEVMHNIRDRFRHKNGSYRWFSTSATFVLNDEGQLLYGIGISQDITERKFSEEALEASEERYKVFIGQSSEAIWRYELEIPVKINQPVDNILAHFRKHGFIAECNEIMASMYGHQSSAQLVGSGLDDILDFNDEKNIEYLKSFIE